MGTDYIGMFLIQLSWELIAQGDKKQKTEKI